MKVAIDEMQDLNSQIVNGVQTASQNIDDDSKYWTSEAKVAFEQAKAGWMEEVDTMSKRLKNFEDELEGERVRYIRVEGFNADIQPRMR